MQGSNNMRLSAYMHVCATLHKYRVLRYLICFLEENAANSV